MKATVIDGVSELPGLVAVSVYEKNPFHFLSMCFNSIEWVSKTWQVYDHDTKIVRDAHFLQLNVNDCYKYNMNSVDRSDQLQNVYWVDHCMCRYKWRRYLLFWENGLVLFNAYIIYKKACEEVKVKPMSHY